VGIYDPAINGEHFPGGRIILIAPVQDGIYVSTEKAIYFLSGLNPKEWACTAVCEYPAVEWARCQTLVDPTFFGFETNAPSPIIGTVNGPLLLFSSGKTVNLIDKNIFMPTNCERIGSICLFDESLIIQSGE
jgi:hypothetical protein